ncbi:unnamed protein product [Linum tenue]|uniref:Uncharacterized protein n=1 Tax=Linum tenue TaxID=586396 RepID=A0AAV0LXR1_9ROSI|nr:unnamed protein product [Linum tenue]
MLAAIPGCLSMVSDISSRCKKFTACNQVLNTILAWSISMAEQVASMRQRDSSLKMASHISLLSGSHFCHLAGSRKIPRRVSGPAKDYSNWSRLIQVLTFFVQTCSLPMIIGTRQLKQGV